MGIAADHQTFETPACKYPALYTNLQYKYSEIDAKLKALSEKITADEISKTSKTIIKTKELQRSSEDKQANDSCNFTSKFNLFYAVLRIKTIFYFSLSVLLSK